MPPIQIFSDSSCDMTDAFYSSHQVTLIPFYVTFDKEVYYKERVEISNSELYSKLRSENVFPSTSQPTASDYESAFLPALENGMDIICLCISSKFSGSFQSAVIARQSLLEQYPDRKIAIIDSIHATCSQGLVLSDIIRMRDSGYDYETIVSVIEEVKNSGRTFFTLDSLEYLQKGGRIGKAASLAGTLLQIKPIISMKGGELVPLVKVRGRKSSMRKLIELAKEYVGINVNDYNLIVIHSDCVDDANQLTDGLRQAGLAIEYPPHELGVTIGAHTGPTLVGLCLLKKFETYMKN